MIGAKVRLAVRSAAGKAVGEVPDAEATIHSPAWRDRGQRLEHERAPGELGVGDGQAARAESPAAPQDEVEVEHAWAPAPPPAATEGAFDRFEARQHLGWFGIAFDQRRGIGEIAAGAAMRRVEDDRRGVEQAEVFVQLGDRGLDHAGRAPVAAVGPVGSDRDGVEVRAFGQSTSVRPEPVDGLPFTSDPKNKNSPSTSSG